MRTEGRRPKGLKPKEKWLAHWVSHDWRTDFLKCFLSPQCSKSRRLLKNEKGEMKNEKWLAH